VALILGLRAVFKNLWGFFPICLILPILFLAVFYRSDSATGGFSITVRSFPAFRKAVEAFSRSNNPIGFNDMSRNMPDAADATPPAAWTGCTFSLGVELTKYPPLADAQEVTRATTKTRSKYFVYLTSRDLFCFLLHSCRRSRTLPGT